MTALTMAPVLGNGSEMRSVFSAAAVLAVSLAAPADAIDLGKVLAKPIAKTYHTPKPMYDIERCLIVLDGPGLPSVFRQPDRPDDEMIAIAGPTTIVLVYELHREASGTEVRVRLNRLFAGGALLHLPPGFEGCL